MPNSHDEIRAILIENLTQSIALCRKYKIDRCALLGGYKMREAIDHSLWKLIELDGKYGGPYQSAGVRKLHKNLRLKKCGRWKPIRGTRAETPKDIAVRLDHVVCRASLSDALLKGEIEAKDIEKHLIGCVVLKVEHDKLNDKYSTLEDKWGKYRVAGIEVYKKVGDDWCRHRTDSR